MNNWNTYLFERSYFYKSKNGFKIRTFKIMFRMLEEVNVQIKL